MAKVAGPLLSLSASGKFANTLVASVWKGIPYMRQFVVPANPQTTAQMAHRDLFSLAVVAWQTIKAVAIMKTAWGVDALMSPLTQSGFNALMSNAIKLMTFNSDGSMATGFTTTAGCPVWTMKNLDDLATGDEAGDFEIWQGSTKSNLAFVETKQIAAGTITGTVVSATGTYFWALYKATGATPAVECSRAGIVTLLATKP